MIGLTTLQDSGDRTLFKTGAVRDIHEGKGRCDLLPLAVVAEIMKHYDEVYAKIIADINAFRLSADVSYLYDVINLFVGSGAFGNKPEMVLEVAKHFEDGCNKYGERNWEKGIPIHCYIDSAIRHLTKYIAEYDDERHDRAFVWNIMCCIYTIQHMPELDDYTLMTKEETEEDI